MGAPRMPLRTDGRLPITAISTALLLYYLSLSKVLGQISAVLGSQLESEDERGNDYKRMEAFKAAIILVRLSAVASACMAGAGLVGIVRERLAPLRMFTLSNFLSLLAEIVCLIFVACLAFSSTSTSSFSSSLCEALTSNSDLAGSFDLFGWSVETCEERWQSLATGGLVFVGAISLVRAWAAFRVLTYYTILAKRLRRQTLTVNTRSNSDHYSDAGSSRDLASPGGSQRPTHRIFLLPTPVESARSQRDLDVPLVAITPSTPIDSFPPLPAHKASVSLPEEQQYCVYAPVMMTADQARNLNAKEVLYSNSRSRPRSHTSTSIPSPGPETPVDISLLALVTDDGSIAKGKLA
ncbi:hypothetical protein P7C70_g7089, partial [Phenoliferia sp. Uapishka_3]